MRTDTLPSIDRVATRPGRRGRAVARPQQFRPRELLHNAGRIAQVPPDRRPAPPLAEPELRHLAPERVRGGPERGGLRPASADGLDDGPKTVIRDRERVDDCRRVRDASRTSCRSGRTGPSRSRIFLSDSGHARPASNPSQGSQPDRWLPSWLHPTAGPLSAKAGFRLRTGPMGAASWREFIDGLAPHEPPLPNPEPPRTAVVAVVC
jgi:hypothetical protein